jgi:hypothetical protein
MPGLVPGIHVLCRSKNRKTWMAGTKPGHDEKGRAASNPEIRRLHLLVASQFRAGAVHDHIAAFQHIGALHQ